MLFEIVLENRYSKQVLIIENTWGKIEKKKSMVRKPNFE